jgi:hypothetical protein
MFYNVINKIPRTSSSIEGWYRSLNSRISHKTPSFFELIQVLLS